LFFGQLVRSCYEDNRLAVPAKLGSSLVSPIVVTQGFDRNILVMPDDVFEKFIRLLMNLNVADPLTRRLQRLLIGNATYCEIDKNGMIVLPAGLRQMAGITSEAVWVGQGTYMEIWSQESWRQQEFELQDFISNTQRFASLNIAGL